VGLVVHPNDNVKCRGTVIATTQHGEDIIVADVNMDKVDEVRESIPVSTQKRDDLYFLEDKQN